MNVIKGFNKGELTDLSNQLLSLRNSDQRTKLFVLSVFLFWLKTGETRFKLKKRLTPFTLCKEWIKQLLQRFLI